MFGTNGNDNMQGLQAKNFKFDDSVDIDDAPDWLVTKLADLNHFEKHLKNGITHICKNQNPQNPHLQNDKFTNLQNIVSNETALNSQNSQTSCHSELSQESEESRKNLQASQNTLKGELTFTEKLLLKDFAYKLYGVKIPETKQRIGIDAATQCKISLF